MLAVGGALLLLDQVTKALARAHLAPAQSVPLLDGVFYLTYILNPGAAFGLFAGGRTLFLATFAIVVVLTAVYWAVFRPNTWWVVIAIAMFMSGALGNFIDRLLFGKVTDFLDFALIRWPVFNIADMAIVTGITMLIIWVIFEPKEKLDGDVASQSDSDEVI